MMIGEIKGYEQAVKQNIEKRVFEISRVKSEIAQTKMDQEIDRKEQLLNDLDAVYDQLKHQKKLGSDILSQKVILKRMKT